MGDEHHGPPLDPALGRALEALPLECQVARRNHLVEQQHVAVMCVVSANPSRVAIPDEKFFTGTSANLLQFGVLEDRSNQRRASRALRPNSIPLVMRFSRAVELAVEPNPELDERGQTTGDQDRPALGG